MVKIKGKCSIKIDTKIIKNDNKLISGKENNKSVVFDKSKPKNKKTGKNYNKIIEKKNEKNIGFENNIKSIKEFKGIVKKIENAGEKVMIIYLDSYEKLFIPYNEIKDDLNIIKNEYKILMDKNEKIIGENEKIRNEYKILMNENEKIIGEDEKIRNEYKILMDKNERIEKILNTLRKNNPNLFK